MDKKLLSCPHCGRKGEKMKLGDIITVENSDLLKSCPHCGGTRFKIYQDGDKIMHLSCLGGKCSAGMTSFGETVEEIAAAWNQRVPAVEWVPVTERLSESGVHVLLCCEIRPSGKKYVCDGYYAAPRSICTGNDDLCYDYSEEEDKYYLFEGWYEVIKNWDDFSSVAIADFVTQWMPLPKPPEEG